MCTAGAASRRNRPRLYSGTRRHRRLVERLVCYALAMVHAEAQRRGLPAIGNLNP